MLYFKVTGDLIDYEYPNSDRQEEREFKRSIRRKIEKLNAKEEGKTYSFIIELDTDTVLTGISIQHTDDLEKKWYTFMNALEIPVSKLRVEEITLGDFSDLLYDANREGYLSDSDDALEMLHLHLITGRFGREFPFEEEILGIRSKEEIYAEAQKYFFQEDLFSELDRIYSVSAPENIYGHPVHYLFESDDEDSLRENTSLLLQGLYENGRLKSKRFNTMVFKPGGIQFNVPAFEALYRSCAGGALIFSYYVDNESEENGLLSKGHLVEVGRGDLVGKYVGWTASIVKKKFQEAKGGVLFIDEAYSLVDDRSGSFGDEGINTIVQEMENHRENVVVIFAGYPNPMESFLDKNPGLRSRIAFHVPFEDYSALELCEIIQLLAKNKGMTFTQDALTRLENVFDIAKAQSDFGNGRYARNLLEQSRMNQAERLLEYPYEDITEKDVVTITAEDILIPERTTKERRRIGFVA